MKVTLLQILSVLAVAGISPVVSAQAIANESAYPSKPIRLVVPFVVGGSTDIEARLLGDKLTRRLGQQVLIENRGGASGTIGMEIVARAPADGYTIVIAVVGPWAMSPHLYKVSYDVFKDFAPIIHASSQAGVVVVHPSVPVKTVKELIALAKRKPLALAYGSSGTGGHSHLSGELFALMSNIKMTHVPYKGTGAALNDLGGGHIQAMFVGTVPALPHIKSGRVRALATTGAARVAVLPDLPTVAEAGVPGYEITSWTGISAPARTPATIILRLNKEFAAILQTPDIQERYAAVGATIAGGPPEKFRDHLKSEFAKFGKLIKEAHITKDSGA